MWRDAVKPVGKKFQDIHERTNKLEVKVDSLIQSRSVVGLQETVTQQSRDIALIMEKFEDFRREVLDRLKAMEERWFLLT